MELLKRLLNYAAACGRLTENPIARVNLLRVPNTRRVVLDEDAFQRLSAKAEARLQAEDTKTEEPRVVYLTERVRKSLSEQPRLLHAEFVFEEQDLKAAVALLNRTRKGAEEVQATESTPGPEPVSVDDG